jgi:hypothetical protein
MSFQDVRGLIASTAARYGVDPALLAAQAWAESGFNPMAQSHAGAKGMMQFMDKTWAQFGQGKSVWDPAASLDAAVRYLQYIQDYLGPDLASPTELALASYNWGQGNVLKLIKRTGRTDWPYVRAFVPAETRDYVDKILAKAPTFWDAFSQAQQTEADWGAGEGSDWGSEASADSGPASSGPAEGGTGGGYVTGESGWTSYAMAAAIVAAAVLLVLILRRLAA